ncbi:hypothetical protein ACFR9U_18540 [Halorientalis brevis]|uniref:DUF7979 domain-containing protein n=1 Tax=Halorientalis brevis TaxID=1126241 RepID=A0ABD6CGB2_9EURY|nr:hypothetical protein [Halorientalis brevis]
MNDHRVLGGALLVLAALLVANPLYIFQHPDEINEVQVGNYYDRTPTANYTYEELSPRAQDVVRKAIESPDNSTRFRGDEARPPEFTFARPSNDTRDVARSRYRVAYNGTNYTLRLVYDYSATRSTVTLGESENRTATANYTYEQLSPRAQELFRTVHAASNNTTTFQGDEKRPPEFRVAPRTNATSGIVVGSVYRVEYNGTNYTIETFTPPRVMQSETRRSQSLVVFGLILGAIGALFVWRPQPLTLGYALGGFGAVFLVLNLAYRYTPTVAGWVTVFGSSIFVMLAILGGIVSGGYLVYKTNRERRLSQVR